MKPPVHPCASCGVAVAEAFAFCPSCGALRDGATVTAPPQVVTARTSPRSRQGHFEAGTLLATRYRIVAPLGRGGMGEVYRAEDLKLDQNVALKFLPAALPHDAAGLARFHNEVRLARQIAHPNVCRVYDIGEVGGEPFLSMEYVDGEDLASLLRRIGRLPHDKTIELARQLCAGLAAAHDNGILHRDLKPSNVMIDGRGRLKITDFGLAQITGGEAEVAGTPAYIAPEQLSGVPATVRSDIYALGLVLYEMVSGKAAFEARSFLDRSRTVESSPPPLSSVSQDVDPVLARLVARCLDPDPEQRPSSAAQVAAMLPGGDPLAAALAAGETPSPELVAAAGEAGSLRPWIAWALAAGIVVCLALWSFVIPTQTLHRLVPLETPPEVLEDRARSVLAGAGLPDAPRDHTSGFIENVGYLLFAAREGLNSDRWVHLSEGRPAGLQFWYREADVPLAPWSWASPVTLEDPPHGPGSRSVILDTRGRLLGLWVASSSSSPSTGAAPDWNVLFGAAGLDLASFDPATPVGALPVYADRRASWTGTLPESPHHAVRVEAASAGPVLVYFAIHAPWSAPPGETPDGMRILFPFFVFLVVLALVLVTGGVLLALRNLRFGRGDRTGARRLALTVFVLVLLQRLLLVHHVADPVIEVRLLWEAAARGVAMAALTWIGYLALEPYVRRRWPDRIVSWTRLLAGRWRDPMVGRDVLVGAFLGALTMPLTRLTRYLGRAVSGTTGMVDSTDPRSFSGVSSVIANLAEITSVAVIAAFSFMMLLVLLTILLRRRRVALAAFWLLVATVFVLGNATPLDRAMAWMPATMALVLLNWGVLTIVAFHLVLLTLQRVPATVDFTAWYADRWMMGMLFLIGLTAYGVYTSLAGRPLAALKLPDDL